MAESDTFNQLNYAYNEEIDEIYGNLFVDDFLNFGLWRNISLNHISKSDRLLSMQQLYRAVFDQLSISAEDRILEIGCGRGRGAALAWEKFSPAEVHGVDVLPSQIAKANRLNHKAISGSSGKLRFKEGSATELPYSESRFSKAFSVEAINHFSDIDRFAVEVYRVLEGASVVAIAAALFYDPESHHERLAELLGEFDDSPLRLPSVDGVKNSLACAGFFQVQDFSIGKDVWEGMYRWAVQNGFEDSPVNNWKKAYDEALVDYYILTAIKK